MASVNAVSSVVIFDEVLSSLARCLYALTRPFALRRGGNPDTVIPGGQAMPTFAAPSSMAAAQAAPSPIATPAPADFTIHRPQLWLTLLVQTHPHLQPLHPVRVLVHGVLLNSDTLPPLLVHIRGRLQTVEANLSESSAAVPVAPFLPAAFAARGFRSEEPERSQSNWNSRGTSMARRGSVSSDKAGDTNAGSTGTFGKNRKQRGNRSEASASASSRPSPASAMVYDDSFAKSLRHCVFAAHLLPATPAASLIMLTDGVVGVPDQAAMEAVLQKFLAAKISCSFVQLGAAYHPYCSLGEVPDTDLLHFLASATGGGVFFSHQLPALPVQLKALLAAPVSKVSKSQASRRKAPGGAGNRTRLTSTSEENEGPTAVDTYPGAVASGSPRRGRQATQTYSTTDDTMDEPEVLEDAVEAELDADDNDLKTADSSQPGAGDSGQAADKIRPHTEAGILQQSLNNVVALEPNTCQQYFLCRRVGARPQPLLAEAELVQVQLNSNTHLSHQRAANHSITNRQPAPPFTNSGPPAPRAPQPSIVDPDLQAVPLVEKRGQELGQSQAAQSFAAHPFLAQLPTVVVAPQLTDLHPLATILSPKPPQKTHSDLFATYRPPPVSVYRKCWKHYVTAVDMARCVPGRAQLGSEERRGVWGWGLLWGEGEGGGGVGEREGARR